MPLLSWIISLHKMKDAIFFVVLSIVYGASEAIDSDCQIPEDTGWCITYFAQHSDEDVRDTCLRSPSDFRCCKQCDPYITTSAPALNPQCQSIGERAWCTQHFADQTEDWIRSECLVNPDDFRCCHQCYPYFTTTPTNDLGCHTTGRREWCSRYFADLSETNIQSICEGNPSDFMCCTQCNPDI